MENKDTMKAIDGLQKKRKQSQSKSIVTKEVEKRFKILYLLASNVGVWEDKMQELGNALDSGHEKAIEALNFYEDKIIEVLEA